MIVNYWIVITDTFKDEMRATLGDIFTPPVPAVTYPLLNTAPAVASRSFRQAPASGAVRFTDVPGFNVYSGYIDVQHLGLAVPLREFFQAMEKAYYPDFWVAGMWSWDGEPVGGAGAPWFPMPTELAPLMGGAVRDVNLSAGQQPRKFV